LTNMVAEFWDARPTFSITAPPKAKMLMIPTPLSSFKTHCLWVLFLLRKSQQRQLGEMWCTLACQILRGIDQLGTYQWVLTGLGQRTTYRHGYKSLYIWAWPINVQGSTQVE
jgi:hypothetical protein